MLRRVGRNLVIFQQIEHFLKFLLSSHRSSGTAETLHANVKAQAECISTKTLGILVEKYKTEILHDAGEEIPEVERPAGWFSFSYRLSVDKEFLESLHTDLKVMTDERNALVHHFLPRWQPGSEEVMTEALAYLDVVMPKYMAELFDDNANFSHNIYIVSAQHGLREHDLEAISEMIRRFSE